MSQEVIALKLSTGEEIIARVKAREDYFVLDRPNLIGLAPHPDGRGVGIQMMPWLASNQAGEVKVTYSHIVAETEPHEDLVKGYLKQTTGIELA